MIDVAVNPVVAIEGLYSFNGLGEKNIRLPVSINPPIEGQPPSTVDTDFFANANMQYGTVSAIFQRPEGGARPFGLVGMGVYYRPMEITTPGVGWVPGYCDPWWYVCYPGGWVEVDQIVGERSTTDFGMVFGGGVRFGAFYAELRYHYIWGPTIEGLDRSNLPNLPPASTSLPPHSSARRPTASSYRRPSGSGSSTAAWSHHFRSTLPPPKRLRFERR